MRILVIGSSGQLARSLAERSLEQPDLRLHCLGRPSLDLERPGSAATAIADLRPDLVINTAAFTAVDLAEGEPLAQRINCEGAREVAEAAAAANSRLIHISTDYVTSGDIPGLHREDQPVGPINEYGRSKLAGEVAVAAANEHAIIVRTSWLYSPFGTNFVRTMIEAAKGRDELRVIDDQFGNPTSALDLSDALLTMAVRGGAAKGRWAGEIFNVAGTGVTSWAGLAQEIMNKLKELGRPHARVIPISSAEWPAAAARPRNSALDCRKVAGAFAIELPQWRRSVASVVERLAQQT